ncbi:MAG: hypothetical protein FD147_14 [Chloroflexi bacterium]|nr:MAG: hypothetical protein FD147_14 [Chloroflexota bacterium]
MLFRIRLFDRNELYQIIRDSNTEITPDSMWEYHVFYSFSYAGDKITLYF